jgi:hypothetical protein
MAKLTGRKSKNIEIQTKAQYRAAAAGYYKDVEDRTKLRLNKRRVQAARRKADAAKKRLKKMRAK